MMTHILLNPGYSTKLNRSKKLNGWNLVEETRRECSKIVNKGNFERKNELDLIRSKSRSRWRVAWEDPGKPDVKSVYDWESTYARHHELKQPDCVASSRPTSPTRRNNPHPSRVFLHLHVANESDSKDEQMDDDIHKIEPRRRAASTMYFTLKEMKRLNRKGQTELLRKLENATEYDKHHSCRKGITGRVFAPHNSTENRVSTQLPKENTDERLFVPSMYRWLKNAGKEEREKVNGIRRKICLQNANTKTVDANRYLLNARTLVR